MEKVTKKDIQSIWTYKMFFEAQKKYLNIQNFYLNFMVTFFPFLNDVIRNILHDTMRFVALRKINKI